MKTFHILNGDALKERFPKTITGEQIIFRECFCDGPINFKNQKDLFEARKNFLQKNYNAQEGDYRSKFIDELQKIKSIPNNSKVVLWFEYDLFCQVNLWFLSGILLNNLNQLNIFLVLPDNQNLYRFWGMTDLALTNSFQNNISLSLADLKQLNQLWKYFCEKSPQKLMDTSQSLKSKIEYIDKSVAAANRTFDINHDQHPINIIRDLIKENQINDFNTIYKIFVKEEPSFGYGDLQIKRYYDLAIIN